MNKPAVTIIVLNHNGFKDTVKCLTSLLKTKYPNFKVFVVDNGSTLNEAKLLASKFTDKRLCFIRFKKNYGFTGGNNRMLARIRTKYFVLLNNDTVVTPTWLEKLVEVAEKNPRIAACQPKIKNLYNNDYFDYAGASGGFMDKYGFPFCRGRFFFSIEKDVGQYDDTAEIFWGCGSALLIRTSVCKKIGLFDDFFFAYQEEIDFFFRVQKAGYKVFVVPSSLVYHKGLGTTLAGRHAFRIFLVHRNTLAICLKYLPLRYLLLRPLFDLASILFYLLTNQAYLVFSVIKAYLSCFINLKSIFEKRNPWSKDEFVKNSKVYMGSGVIKYFFAGKKRFSEVMGPKIKNNSPLINTSDLVSPKKSLYRFFPLVFLIFSFVIAAVWFKDGYLLAAGEEGMAIYNPLRTLRVYKNVWYETGAGYPLPVNLPRITFFAIASILNIFVANYLTQSIIFSALLFSGITGVYLVTKELTDEKTAFFSSFFYFLNLYSLSQVWMRFLYTGIFTWAYLPIFLYLTIKLTLKPKVLWVFLFILSSLIFSTSYGHPAFIVTIWAPTLIFVFFKIFKEKQIKGRVVYLLRFLSYLVVWIIINLWWIYPYLIANADSFSKISDWKYNLNSLMGVSQYFNSDQILTLRQGFLFGKDSVFYSFYSHPIVQFVSILILVITLRGLIKGGKLKNWYFLVLLAFVGWFICKGSNPPFGRVFFEALFSKLSFAAALRNPYEKFGDVWLLAYSIFFGLGLQGLRRRTLLIILSAVYVFLVWPMWTGSLFLPHKINVPDYYEKANTFLNNQKDEGRVLILPIIYGDSVHYTWGYKGLEPSEFIFDRPAISKMLRTKYFDEKYVSLHNAFVGEDNYNKLFDEMHITYLLLHEDLISEDSIASSSADVKKKLDANPQVEFLKKEGNLLVYKYNSEKKGGLFVLEGDNIPKFDFIKESSQRYLLRIHEVKSPFRLIFKNTFSDLWVARINGQILPRHELAYGYANSWWVNKMGSYQIEIVFKIWPWE